MDSVYRQTCAGEQQLIDQTNCLHLQRKFLLWLFEAAITEPKEHLDTDATIPVLYVQVWLFLSRINLLKIAWQMGNFLNPLFNMEIRVSSPS